MYVRIYLAGLQLRGFLHKLCKDYLGQFGYEHDMFIKPIPQ